MHDPDTASLRPPPLRAARVACALLLAALVPALPSAWLHPHAPSWTRTADAGDLSWAQARALRAALWIDARPADQFHRAHVPGALSLPASEWDSRIESVLAAWRPGLPVVVYCDGHGCQASRAVAQRLRDELGLPDIHVLAAGWPPPETPAP